MKKLFAVPTAYHCEDDNETSCIIAYIVEAEDKREAKIITREIIEKEELEILDDDDKELLIDDQLKLIAKIWFQDAEEGIDNYTDEEGFIIGEPNDISCIRDAKYVNSSV